MKEFEKFIDLSDYNTQPISRRDVLKKGAKAAVALSSAGIIFNKILPNLTPDSLDLTYYYELLVGQDLRFYAHDAAEDLRRLDRAFGLGAGIEANIISVDGNLYVAHDMKRFGNMSQNEKREYEAERVIDYIVRSGESPALDIKFSEADENGAARLHELVGNIPADTFTTISGSHHSLLDQFESGENRFISYTVKDSSTYHSFINRANDWREQQNDLNGIGVALNIEMAYRGKLKLFKETYGIPATVWVVNDVEDMVTFQQDGAAAITTDRLNVIGRVNSAQGY